MTTLFRINCLRLFLALVLSLSMAVGTILPAYAATLNVPSQYPTIQAAINAAVSGDTINVAAGTYAETLSLVDKDNLSIIGAGPEQTIIDASSSLGYGWDLRASGVSLSDFKFIGPSAGTYGIKVSGIEPNPAIGFTIQNVIIQNSKRTGLDINGVNGVTVTGVTVTNTANGAGIALTDVSSATLTNVTTSGNAWGSIAIMTYGRYFPGGSDGITLTNITSTEPVYTEVANYTTSSNPYPVTNLTASEFAYKVINFPDRPSHVYYTETEAEATALAALFPHPEKSVVLNASTGPTLVTPGMSIQAAVNAAPDGGTIYVAAGTYTEAIALNKRVSLIGAGIATVITNPPSGDASLGVFQVSASGLSDAESILLKDLLVKPNQRAGISVGKFGAVTATSVSYLKLENVDVIGTNTNPCTEQERGLFVDPLSSLLHLTITDSAFNNLTYGWYLQKAVSADSSTVQYVNVTNTTFNHNSLKGLYAEKLEDATFTNVIVDGNGFMTAADVTACSYFQPWQAGVDINLKAGTYQNLTFVNPTVTDNALGGVKEGTGMALKAREDGTTYGPFPATLDNVVVTGGTFTGNERGIRIGEPGKNNAGPTHVVIHGANISNNVKTYSGSDGSPYGGVVNQSLAVVDATDNWWGTANPVWSSAISGNVTHTTYCIDSACGGFATLPVQNTTRGTYYATIQEAIDAAIAGDTIEVAAGTYAEDLVISKGLTLLGPNAAINPNTGARVAEAVIHPSTSNPNPAVCTNMVYLQTSNITIKGFTFDGNNPAITGGYTINGSDVDACEILAGYEGMGNIVVENNILRRATYAGIDFYNYTNSTATAGNYIRYNLLEDIGETSFSYGIGILVYNNFYADITDNVLNRVRVGIQTGNFSAANPGATGRISNNVINTWRLGIFHNLWYSSASVISVDHNTINATTYPGANKWNGILLSTFQQTTNTIVADNIINIPETVTFTAPGYTAGYNVWSTTTTASLTISGGTVTGGDYGVFVNNYEGYDSNANNTSIILDGLTLLDSKIAGVYAKDSASNTNGATVFANIKDSTIDTAATGILIEGSDATAQANFNRITGNPTMGVYNTTATAMNAQNNWWGAITGPNAAGHTSSGDSVSQNVDYSPWCGDPECTTFYSLGTPPVLPSSFYGAIHFNDNAPSDGQLVEAYLPGMDNPIKTVAILQTGSELTYSFDIPGDILNTPDREGGVEGETITFKINGRVVATYPWHSGTNKNLSLHPPKAVLASYTGTAGSPIAFSGSALDAGNDATTYEWDWDNDGTYDETGQNLSHTFANVGIYTTGLKVTDSQGGVDTATTTVNVGYISASITISNVAQTYNGSPKPVTVITNPEGLSYSLVYSSLSYGPSADAPTDAGSYAITATITTPNYSGSDTKTLVIAKATTTTMVSGGGTFVFDGSAHAATVTVTGAGGLNLTPDPVYSCTTAPINVAQTPCTASYTYAGDVNHEGSTGSAAITITPKPITVTPNAGQSKTFGAPDTTFGYTSDPLIGPDTFTGALGREQGENVGTYAYNFGTLSAGNNYELTLSFEAFAITPRLITVTPDANQSKVFGTADPTFTYIHTALIGTDQITGALERQLGENVGIYPFTLGTLSAGTNYSLTLNAAAFAITPASATVTLSNLVQVYDGTPKAVTVTTHPAGLSIQVTYGGSTTPPTEPGSYSVSATITDPNYTGSASSTLVIQAKHSIALVPGWNLVSFNIHPVDTDIAAVLSSIEGSYDLLYAWDASGANVSSGHWLKYDNIPFSPDSLTTLDETMGFWIHMTVADTLDVIGSRPATTSITLSDNAGGWNLVSFPAAGAGTLPEILSENGVGTDFSLVYAYHANDAADPWKLFTLEVPSWANDLNQMEPGWGYWVRVNADMTWTVVFAPTP